MKKILAIALAVVMVLTMTAAFAWSWTCPSTAAKTGKATIEVIPYVKVNNGCGGFDWVQSNCAAAVKSEKVYFLVKMTIPQDISPLWYKYITADGVKLTFAKDGFNATADSTAEVSYSVQMPATVDALKAQWGNASDDGWVLYAVPRVFAAASLDAKTGTGLTGATATKTTAAGQWYEATENSNSITDYMFGANVADARKAKVCAKFTSDFNGMGEWLTYGDYKVAAIASGTKIASLLIVPSCVETPAIIAAKVANGGPITNFAGVGGGDQFKLDIDQTTGKISTASITEGTCSADFANKALAYFGLQLGTCINQDNIKANFGWKDKVESCFTWSGNATAIVDVQCEVEIPKTGDVSVIAYAVMAVVAAAGAMGLKK